VCFESVSKGFDEVAQPGAVAGRGLKIEEPGSQNCVHKVLGSKLSNLECLARERP